MKNENEIPNEELNTFTLVDDEGQEFEFELLDYVDYKDKLYTLLVPPADSDEEESIVVMLTEFEGEEPIFTFVEDTALAEEVLAAYIANSEEEDFETEYVDDDEE